MKLGEELCNIISKHSELLNERKKDDQIGSSVETLNPETEQASLKFH